MLHPLTRHFEICVQELLHLSYPRARRSGVLVTASSAGGPHLRSAPRGLDDRVDPRHGSLALWERENPYVS